MKDYEALLLEVARDEEARLSQFDTEAARAAFIMEISRYPSGFFGKRRRIRIAVLSAMAAAVILLGVSYFIFSSFSFDTGTINSDAHRWVKVGPDDSEQISLEDGTQVVFLQNSTGRISQNVTHRGEVSLENGRVTLAVPHRQDTNWKVFAGPYKVAVTGTKFEVRWNPQSSDLTVNVFEGSVVVTGPLLETGHSVTSNRSLSANLQQSSVQMTPVDPSLENQQHTDTGTGSKQRSAVRSGRKSGTHGVYSRLSNAAQKNRKTESVDPLEWVTYAQNGQYDKVSEIIQSTGLNQMLKDAPPSAWLILGNAARQSRDFNTARTVYSNLRDRYPNSGHATTAALYLGRMAFDQQHQYAVAAKWFKIYLSEQKGGTLHREVLGRLMETQYKANMHSDAKHTATKYLEQYPEGPQAGRARELSGK